MILFEGTPEEIKALLAERAAQTPDPPPLPKLEPEEVPGPPISRKARLLNAVVASLAQQIPEDLCLAAAQDMTCTRCPVRDECTMTISGKPGGKQCASNLLRWLTEEDKTQ